MLRSPVLFFSLVLISSSLAVCQSSPITVTPGNSLDSHIPKPDAQAQPQAADTTPHLKPVDLDSGQNLNDGTKMQLIRVMDAEFVHVRKYFPVGEKSMVIATGWSGETRRCATLQDGADLRRRSQDRRPRTDYQHRFP